MNVLEAISRSEELATRIVALDNAILRYEMTTGMQGYAHALQRIKEEVEQEAEEIKYKLKIISFE